MLQSKEFDIAILDVMMPYVDGLAVLKSIRNDPRTADLPVILLTVKAQDDDIYEGYREGADMYLIEIQPDQRGIAPTRLWYLYVLESWMRREQNA